MPISRRSTRPIAALVAASLALVAAAGPAAAAAPLDVTIASDVTFADPGEPNFGDFEASGPAVVAGTICDEGTFVDTGLRFAGFQGRQGEVQLQVHKTFTCDDGSGTFDVKMQIQANFDTGIETFQWVVTGGTEAYASLRGGGRGSTVPRPGGNTNTFVGQVR